MFWSFTSSMSYSTKYSNFPNNLFYEFFGSPNHHMNQCWSLDTLADHLDHSAFHINKTPRRWAGGAPRGGRSGERGQLGVMTMIRKDMLWDNSLCHKDLGVHTIEWIPMQLKIFLNLLLSGRNETRLNKLIHFVKNLRILVLQFNPISMLLQGEGRRTELILGLLISHPL